MRNHATLLGAVLLGFISVLSYAQAPVPFINLPLIPGATAPGGPQFTLTVNGTGFVSNSTVNWNGSPLATQFVRGSQLTATIPAEDIAMANTGWVTVVNPAPGGGTSNVAFFTVTATTGSFVAFTLSSPGTGSYPWSVAVGDFNGDGKLDIAASNYYSNTVSVLLGDGTGNFTLASSPAAGSVPFSAAVGDFNGDGKLDLAVADFSGSAISILLGDGIGNFTLASSPAAGSAPFSVAVGDFNGDGNLDLAVALYTEYTIAILLGDGTGNFTLASSPAVGSAPSSVAVGDFNEDGKLDLAVANLASGTVSILLGDGTGNFLLSSSPAVGIYPQSVAVADFNGDRKLDLAVVNGGSDTVSVLLGDGTGNFTLASSPAAGGYAKSVAVGDFNGDGTLDLAVANSSSGTVSILLGDGTGNFTLASSPGSGYGSWYVAVGDFNGDGRLDLAVGQFGGNAISILRQVSASVTLSPSSLSFGTQLIATKSNAQPVILTNVGSDPLEITSIATSANFAQTNNCPSSVPPGGQCTINVTFSPSFRGRNSGTVTITDNAPNSPQAVPLSGVATAVTLLPSSLAFGNQAVGTTSGLQTVTLTNHGKGAVSILGLGLTGSNPGAFEQTNTCGTSVLPRGSCTFSITFTPKGRGPKSATLEVGDNGGGTSQTVTLGGTGTQ